MLLSEWLKGARGRGAALARHLRMPPSMVTKMAAGEKQIPLDRCPAIQDFTGGAVSCEEQRPDKVAYFAHVRALGANDPAIASAPTGAAHALQGEG